MSPTTVVLFFAMGRASNQSIQPYQLKGQVPQTSVQVTHMAGHDSPHPPWFQWGHDVRSRTNILNISSTRTPWLFRMVRGSSLSFWGQNGAARRGYVIRTSWGGPAGFCGIALVDGVYKRTKKMAAPPFNPCECSLVFTSAWINYMINSQFCRLILATLWSFHMEIPMF